MRDCLRGRIGNPGRSSLEAAMHPAPDGLLLFRWPIAQGHHRFARTIEEHNKNVDAYRKAMRARKTHSLERPLNVC